MSTQDCSSDPYLDLQYQWYPYTSTEVPLNVEVAVAPADALLWVYPVHLKRPLLTAELLVST